MSDETPKRGIDPFEEQVKAASRLDALILISLCAVALFVLSGLNAFEWLSEWSRTVEAWNVDELFMLSSLGLIAAGVFIFRRWKDLKREMERRRELERRLAMLEGFVPICSYCKSLRSKSGNWTPVEKLLKEDYSLRFIHGVCPRCEEIFVKPEYGAFVSVETGEDVS
ncbi:MAG: hypothetical protein GY906_15155 [bacterium]|nr:hypothetical protein [bacterium]